VPLQLNRLLSVRFTAPMSDNDTHISLQIWASELCRATNFLLLWHLILKSSFKLNNCIKLHLLFSETCRQRRVYNSPPLNPTLSYFNSVHPRHTPCCTIRFNIISQQQVPLSLPNYILDPFQPSHDPTVQNAQILKSEHLAKATNREATFCLLVMKY
jgi:hypothetical protein